MADRVAVSPARRALLRGDGVLRVLGALVGSAPVAVLVAGALAAYAPLPADVRFPLGVLLAIPLWVAGMCAGFLAPRGWLVWLVIAVAFASLRFLVPHASLL